MHAPSRSRLFAMLTSGIFVLAFAAVNLPAQAVVAPAAEGTFHGLAPARVLDTRNGTGAARAPLGAGREISLSIAGRAGIPATGVSAVVLNLTGVSPTSNTYLTVYPSGSARPVVSNLNLQRTVTRANSVTVPVSPDGRVRIYNAFGSVNVLADVSGFYAGPDFTGAPGSFYDVDAPVRWADTREGGEPMQAWEFWDFYWDLGEWNDKVVAAAVNVVAVSPQQSGYLVAWDGAGSEIPSSSLLNFPRGRHVANFAVVPLRPYESEPGIAFTVGNGSNGATHVIVDLVGFYLKDQEAGYRYEPLSPRRLVDTRTNGGAIGAGAVRDLDVDPALNEPDVGAFVGNATVVAPTDTTFLTVWNGAGSVPSVSNLNAVAGQTVANATNAWLSESGFSVYNARGRSNFLYDVSGLMRWSEPAPADALRRGRSTLDVGPRPSDGGSFARRAERIN